MGETPWRFESSRPYGMVRRMNACERCATDHGGAYGSGRFCSPRCARSFSTARDRASISARVSAALLGNPPTSGSFTVGKDPRRRPLSDEDRSRAVNAVRVRREAFYSTAAFDDLPIAERWRRVLSEQGGACLCGISTWNSKKLTLEIDHINGNHFDDRRENLRYLCPNCHSQTPTYRNKKRERDGTADMPASKAGASRRADATSAARTTSRR